VDNLAPLVRGAAGDPEGRSLRAARRRPPAGAFRGAPCAPRRDGRGDRMIVMAGGGLAAQRCCDRLRRKGYDGPITMICDEPYAPYDRPPLSKQFLSGHMTEAPRLRPEAWYADNDVTLLLGERAAALHPHERELELGSGRRLRYDRLLIATGAAPRTMP